MSVLLTYNDFINNPCLKTFNNFLKNIEELSYESKITSHQLEKIKKCLQEKHIDKNGKLYLKNNKNNEPILSASCFPNNFNLPFNNKLWTVDKVNNELIWKLKDDYDFKQIYKKNKLESFILNKKTIENNIGLIKLKNKLSTKGGYLVVGEYSLMSHKVKSDTYSIWSIGGSLIAVPYGTKKIDIYNAKWTHANYYVHVEGGTFGFHNGTIFDFINTMKDGLLMYTKLNGQQYKKNHYWIDILGNDLSKLNNDKLNMWINKNKLNKALVGFYCNNNTGDGTFDVYKSGEMYLIMNSHLYFLINKLKVFQ